MMKHTSLVLVIALLALQPVFGAEPDPYTDITAAELHGWLKDITHISLDSRAAGDVTWGRIAGTKWDKKTADYMKAAFEEIGLDEVWQEEFEIGSPDVAWTEISLTLIGGSSPAAPDHDHLFVSASATIPSTTTPPGGIEAPIVDVGEGSPEELAGIDLTGKIALLHSKVSYGIFRHPGVSAIARIAEDGKALAVVCTVHRPIPSNDQTAITNGPGGAGLPQINLGMGDGMYLSEVIKTSPPDRPPRVRLVAAGTPADDWTTQNTFGLIRGTGDEYVVLQAHTDGYFEAAGDNASGLAALLGLAKHCAARPRQELKRSLLFIATSGHHSGPAVGAWNIVKDHQQELAKTVLVINLEHMASIAPKVPYTGDNAFVQAPHLIYDPYAHPFLIERCREIAERYGVPIVFGRIMEEYQADMYPYAALGPTGLPTFMLLQPMYWYHTAEDDLAKISALALQQITRGHAYLLDALEEVSLAEIRDGRKDRSPRRMPDAYNPLELDLDELRRVEILE